MKLFLVLAAAVTVGVASAQPAFYLVCKGDMWNQFLVPRQAAVQGEVVINLDLSQKTMRFDDPGLGRLEGALLEEPDHYMARASTPANRLGVKRVLVFVNRLTGASSISYYVGNELISSMASFVGKCERASVKF